MTLEVDFVNLSARGPHSLPVPGGHVCRIQSTQCERKQWESVLYGAGPDLLYQLARGAYVVVHDTSERPRLTRAVWQGLPFIRRSCELLWGLALSPIEGRGGRMMEQYFDTVLRDLSGPVRNYVRHYGQYLCTSRLSLQGCLCPLPRK